MNGKKNHQKLRAVMLVEAIVMQIISKNMYKENNRKRTKKKKKG